MGPRPHLRFSAFKTATLAPELQVSIGPSTHLWFLYAKQRLWDQICKFYWSQTSPVVLCMQNTVISTRISSLQGCQTSPLVLCVKNSVLSNRITSPHGTQPSSVVFACKTATFGSELQFSMGPRLRLLTCECKTARLDPE